MSYFNPRTREGCDLQGLYDTRIDLGISIHAPVKGATYMSIKLYILVWYFNPRTREGCDMARLMQVKPRLTFQSTHP